MPIQISELPGQHDFRNDLHTHSLQSSLRHFVRQFSLTGGCIFQFCARSQKPRPIACWSDSSLSPGLLSLSRAIDKQDCPDELLDELFAVVAIETPDFPAHAYRCLLKRTPEVRDYLVCWQQAPLSEHQQYGISLFAQALNSQSPPKRQAASVNPLQQTRHQLRTPLALILLYTDLLKTADLDPRSQEWLEHLRTAAEGMNISLDHLTEWDTEADRTPNHCDLRQLLEQCGQAMQPWLEEKHLKLVHDPRSLWLRVDEWKLKQVFQNLLSNAIAFSPKAGQITWEWQVFQSEVLIKISDQGPGLSAEDLRSIGTPFYSRRPGGTGLGLSIAKQVILEHQGSLWAVNLPAGGAQFCITLPRS